ncbi:MAG: antitoxin CptB [Pseudorhodobacter sp.]|jgi:antitoxin CptB
MNEVIETTEARLKRMSMRSWRRGTKEMDMILGPFSDVALAGMGEADLVLFDRLLWENDTDLLPWMMGQAVPPAHYAGLVGTISTFARARLAR